MRVLSLFSGIGGFDIAARWMGWETIAFCEQDKFCQKVLSKHWPDVPCHDDIKTLDGSQYAGAINMVVGGFPCQPWSTAGEQRGSEDDRHLWPEMLRIIQESRPTWVCGENVAGIIQLGLDGVLADLETAGYACQTLVIPACAIDARHRRDRIWVVAHRNDRPIQQISIRGLEPGSSPVAHTDTQRRQEQQFGQSGRAESVRRTKADVSNTQGVGSQSNEQSRSSHQMSGSGGIPQSDGIYSNIQTMADANGSGHEKQQFPSEHEGLSKGRVWQSLPDPTSGGSTRQAEPGVCRSLDGFPAWVHRDMTGPNYKARIKALGNAIVPGVVYQIFKAIEAAERERNATKLAR